jgi:diguanylate cyclase (GGDEF)-like protein
LPGAAAPAIAPAPAPTPDGPAGPGGQRSTLVDHLGPPTPSSQAEEACLVAIYGDDIGRRIALGTEPMLVGRDASCHLVAEDETVSRRHGEIAWNGHAFRMRDLGSTNGTLVNGQPATDTELHDGDLVKIGRNIYKFLQGGNLEHDYHEVIFELMTHDGLTQAHNRRFFEQALAREIARAARYGRSLALVLFDVDHFKLVNDSKGHLAGDELLRQLAELVQRSIRTEDVLARVGGEEFAVIVPEGTAEGGRQLAERLRKLIETARFEFEGYPVGVTCSFGVAAAFPHRQSTPAELYGLADARLYEAKGRGRNRTVGEEG